MKLKSKGAGICTIVFIVLLFLKLTGINPFCSWSWWWVTSPIWIPIIIMAAFAAIQFILLALIFVTKLKNRGK